MTTPLSPAAHAVIDAYFTHADLLNREVSHEEMLAAALRAAADHLIPDSKQSHQVPGILSSRSQLLAIATELEAQP